MKIWDRENKTLIEEKEYGKKSLEFLYNTVVGRILLKTIFASRWFSKVQGLWQKTIFSKRKIKKFIKEYKIDMSPYKGQKFSSFEHFFTRKRDIENNSRKTDLVSIADAKLLVKDIDENTRLNIKNSSYSIEEIIGKKLVTKIYKGGTCLIYRLAVDDYHRYQYLDSGKELFWNHIKGKLHTVRPIASKYHVYSTNSRDVTMLATKNFGDVIQIEVGAMLIGKIHNFHLKEFNKLDEKGYFGYGGSTIILLFEKGKIVVDNDIIENSKNDIETKVKIGMKIGHKGE